MTDNKIIYVIGAGISGATIARLFAEKGYIVKVLEKEKYVGGNCYDYTNNFGVLIHKYGPHIFHTNNKNVYKFVKRFTKLNNWKAKNLVKLENKKIIPIPFNFKSLDILFPNKSKLLKSLILKEFKNKKTVSIFELKNAKNKNIQELGTYIFNNMYANYSAKMWGTSIEKIDPNVISRVSIILGYKNNYFPNDKYQGLPLNGYTNMIKNMLLHKNIKVFLNQKENNIKLKNNKLFIDNKEIKEKVFYSGQIEKLFEYKFGNLDYRSLKIKFQNMNVESFQEVAVINHPANPDFTRIVEYKKMTLQNIENKTTISKEYPGKYSVNSKNFNRPFYPINNQVNNNKYKKYLNESKKIKNLFLIGRLAQYKYFDMDDAIDNSINIFNKIK